MSLAENIRILRKNKGIPQEELSAVLDVSRQTISKWENETSEPSLDRLVKLADIFKVSLDELIREEIKPVDLFGSQDKTTTNTKDIEEDIAGKEDIEEDSFPMVKVEDIHAFKAFKEAYDINVEINNSGNRENMGKMMNLYLEAFDAGIIEAAVNMLMILTLTQLDFKASNPNKEIPFQERVDYFINALEEAGHPAGGYYKAIGLIYGSIVNDKTDDENWDEGLILMYELANDGNEYAISYVEMIETSEE